MIVWRKEGEKHIASANGIDIAVLEPVEYGPLGQMQIRQIKSIEEIRKLYLESQPGL